MGNSHLTKLKSVENLCGSCADNCHLLNKERLHGYFLWDPLLAAAEQGHAECLQRMIAAGVDVNRSNHCLTALTCAVRNDHVDCVNILLAAGASVNVPHTRGDPPIEEAVRRGNAKCVKMLIEAGSRCEWEVTFAYHSINDSSSRGIL